MVKLTTRSFRKSKEFTPPDTPISTASNGDPPLFDELSDERESTDTDTDRRDSATTNVPNEPCNLNHDGKLVANFEIPINIDEVFTFLFTESKFYMDALIVQRNITEFDITSEWQHDPEVDLKTRRITYTLPLQGLGPKEAYITEAQIMNKCSIPGVRYSIDVWAENGGVPYSDSFNVLVHYCLERITDKSTRICTYVELKFKKNIWGITKGLIERGTLTSMVAAGQHLEKTLRDYCDKKSKRKVRRVNALAGPRLSIPKIQAASAVYSTRPKRSGPRIAWVLLMFTLLVSINVQLYFVLQQKNHDCVLNMDGWKDRLSESNTQEQMEEWTELLDQFTRKQREQLLSIKDTIQQEIHAMKMTEQALSTMIDKLKAEKNQYYKTTGEINLLAQS